MEISSVDSVDTEVVEIITGVIAMLEQDSMFASSIAALGGTDFADVRLRATDDPYKDIDWPRTLATGKTHVRLREQERSVPVCIALDVSNSMRMSGSPSKRDTALEIMDVLAMAALRKSCVIRVVLFSDCIEWVERSVSDPRMYERLREEIAVFQPRNHTMTDIKGLLQYLSWELRTPTLVCVLSDFLSVFGWEEEFESLLGRNEVIPIMMEDPRDYQGPAGFAYCQGIESHNVRLAYSGNNNEFIRVHSFFELLEREGRSIWTRMETRSTYDQRIGLLAEMFRTFEEQLSMRMQQGR